MLNLNLVARAPFFLRNRFQASVAHLSLSMLVAGLASLPVFLLWYPHPYQDISGGRELFLIVVAVDVITGPFVTLLIFDRRKLRCELYRDLLVVMLLQLTALSYGVWTMVMARPVHMVFEIDRFRIVHANEVPEKLLSQVPMGIVALPYAGPITLGLRSFRSERERFEATMSALQGTSLSSRPDLWQSYDSSRGEVLRVAKPVDELISRFPNQAALIERTLAGMSPAHGRVLYLPLAGRKSFWTVLISATNADILGFVPLDSF